MDFLVILACIGAIGAGITIWKAISSGRNGDEDSGHMADADALEAGVVRYLFDALRNNHSKNDFADIVTAASRLLEQNGSIVEIDYDESTGVVAVMHPEERTDRHQHTVPSESPQYLRRLTSVLPKNLQPYREEITQFVEDGIRERLVAGTRVTPFVLSQSFHLAITIFKAKFKLSIIRRRSIN